MLEKFKRHFLTLTLSVCLFSVSLLYIDLYRRFEEQYKLIKKQEEEIVLLKRELNSLTPILELLNMSIRRPKTYYDKGIELVSGYNINYQKIDDKYDLNFFILFYAPLDNLTLKIDLFLWPQDVQVPLTIQKGNALRNETGVLVGRIGGMRVWQSPIIWSINASRVGDYEALHPLKGWYTICITGPIQIDEPEDPRFASHLHLRRILGYNCITINLNFF